MTSIRRFSAAASGESDRADGGGAVCALQPAVRQTASKPTNKRICDKLKPSPKRILQGASPGGRAERHVRYAVWTSSDAKSHPGSMKFDPRPLPIDFTFMKA